MSPYVTRKSPGKTFCSECENLEQRLNAATDFIVETLHKLFISKEEKSQELDKALNVRHRVLETYLGHLHGHRHATAA